MTIDPAVGVAFLLGAVLVYLWYFVLTQRATRAAIGRQIAKRNRHKAITEREEIRIEEVRLREELWDIKNPYNQLRFVHHAAFQPKKLITSPVFHMALQVIEDALEGMEAGHRVLAGVPLCNFLQTTDEKGKLEQRAFLAIRDKQVDFLIIDSKGNPKLAIEGRKANSHTQAALRAVKQKALENAGIPILFISGKMMDAELRVQVIWQLSPR